MITNVGCWIFSRSFDGLRIFSGCSDGSCGPGRSLGYSRSGGSGGSDGSCGSCGSSEFGRSCEPDWLGESGRPVESSGYCVTRAPPLHSIRS